MANALDNLRRVDLNLLTSLRVLLQENNVTGAAKRLNLSQPSVSSQLSKLRDIFQDPLLIPSSSGRGMIPTPKAKRLRQPLEQILRELDVLVSDIERFDPKTHQRVFNVVIPDFPMTIISNSLAKRLCSEIGEGVQIAFHTKMEDLNLRMERGEIDLVITSERQMPLDAKSRVLFKERFIMAQRKGHPRGTSALTLDEYCKLKHLLVSTSGGSLFGFMDEHLVQLGRSRQVSLSVTQFNMIPELLKHSDFVCTLPSRLVDYYADQMDGFELPFEAQGFNLYMGWHTAYDNAPDINWLKDFFIGLFDVRE